MFKNKLFKWIGGKKWLSDEINATLEEIFKNRKIDCYIEPFAGGLGSAIFALPILKKHGIKKVILNDVNTSVIAVYKHIKDDCDTLFNLYWAIESEYSATVPISVLHMNKIKDKETIKELLVPARDFFNAKKKDFNQLLNHTTLERAALFLFLINHAFNGVYRENNKGEFNTPYNWEACVFNRTTKLNTFKEYESAFNEFDLTFENMDAFKFLNKYKELYQSALFYFDPPYLNEIISENKYNKDHFGYKEQIQLLTFFKIFHYVIFSNHYLNLFKEFCENENFIYKEVFRTGNMNSDPTKRGQKVSEILAYKY